MLALTTASYGTACGHQHRIAVTGCSQTSAVQPQACYPNKPYCFCHQFIRRTVFQLLLLLNTSACCVGLQSVSLAAPYSPSCANQTRVVQAANTSPTFLWHTSMRGLSPCPVPTEQCPLDSTGRLVHVPCILFLSDRHGYQAHISHHRGGALFVWG